jgi:hypothetical protein
LADGLAWFEQHLRKFERAWLPLDYDRAEREFSGSDIFHAGENGAVLREQDKTAAKTAKL